MNTKTFSIIIPTCNRLQQLTECLQSIEKLNYPRQAFEIIIINDGQESIEKILLPFEKLDIKLIKYKKHLGPAKARNQAANSATGKFLAFTDDDCVVDTDWLWNLKNAFIRNEDSLIGGKVDNIATSIYSIASQKIIDYLYKANAQFLTSNNLAMKNEIFKQMKGFNELFELPAGEDREFCNRWLNEGRTIKYVPEIVIYHRHEMNFKKFCQQQFNYGRGAYLFHNLKKWKNKKSLPKPSFYLNLLIYPWLNTQGIKKIPIGGLFMVSQLLVASGLIYESLHHQSNREPQPNT